MNPALQGVAHLHEGMRGESHGRRHLQHIVELDGLRGLALVLVLELHFTGSAFHSLRSITGSGWVGVDLFFVLSGFLITRILRNSLGAPHFFRNFYARRALRIWPLYYSAMAFAFVGTRLLPESMQIGAKLAPYYLTFTQNLCEAIGFGPWAVGVTWSLAIEEQFYFLWPLCVRFLDQRKSVALLLAILVAMPFIRWGALLYGIAPQTVYLATWVRLDALSAGAIVAMAVDSGVAPRLRRVAAPVCFAAFAVSAALCIIVCEGDRLVLQLTPIGGARAAAYAGTFSALALGFAAFLLLIVSKPPPLLAKVLRNKGLRYLGRISFGVYIIHGVMIPLCQVLLRAWLHERGVSGTWLSLAVVSAALLSSFVLAELSFRLLESPLLKLRRFFADSPVKGSVVTSS